MIDIIVREQFKALKPRRLCGIFGTREGSQVDSSPAMCNLGPPIPAIPANAPVAGGIECRKTRAVLLVLLHGRSSEVGRINAGGVVTPVVDGHTRRDRPNQHLVCESVCENRLSTDVNSAITSRQKLGPKPTTAKLRRVAWDGAALVYVRPESLLWSSLSAYIGSLPRVVPNTVSDVRS